MSQKEVWLRFSERKFPILQQYHCDLLGFWSRCWMLVMV